MLHESTEELHAAWQARGREDIHEYLVSLREEEQSKKGPAAQVVKFDWNAQSARYRCFYMEEGQQAVGEIREGQAAFVKRCQISQLPNGPMSWVAGPGPRSSPRSSCPGSRPS